MQMQEDVVSKATSRSLWGVVLAGGEGNRLETITSALHGGPLPKQFAALVGERSFLQRTMDRIAPLVPPERTIIVVAPAHAAVAREQLREYRGVELVLQPSNRGTGPGLLLPLSHILHRDPDAAVAVFPSDHHVRCPERLPEAVERALLAAEDVDDGVALIAAEAERPATDMGWIVPGPPLSKTRSQCRHIARFVEKPAPEIADQLFSTGGFWNTLILAGRSSAFWKLGRKHMPLQTRALETYRAEIGSPSAIETLERVYAHMPTADFSQTVLEQAQGLAMTPLLKAGWSDCGTPERLFEAFAGTPEIGGLMARLRRLGPAGRAIIPKNNGRISPKSISLPGVSARRASSTVKIVLKSPMGSSQ